MELKNIVAVVSGGASGLGEACVRLLVASGAKVCILDLDEEKGRGLTRELSEMTLFSRTDVTDEKSVQESIKRTAEAFGGLHVAINCAGVATVGKVVGKRGPMPIEEFSAGIQVNLVGTMNVIRLAAEQMMKNQPNSDGERGVMVNTASIVAFDEGQSGSVAYVASKAGVVGMTMPIAREFAEYGIRIVAIAPGTFETPMVKVMSVKFRKYLSEMLLFPRRLGRPIEFAKLALHIIENTMLNGTCIRIDGGVRLGVNDRLYGAITRSLNGANGICQ